MSPRVPASRVECWLQWEPVMGQSFCGYLRHRQAAHLQGATKRQADHGKGADQHADRDQLACALTHRITKARPWSNGEPHRRKIMRCYLTARLVTSKPPADGSRQPGFHTRVFGVFGGRTAKGEHLLQGYGIRRDRTQRRAAEETHFDVLREAMKAEEPALTLVLDAIEG